jgi:hypothetical protein
MWCYSERGDRERLVGFKPQLALHLSAKRLAAAGKRALRLLYSARHQLREAPGHRNTAMREPTDVLSGLPFPKSFESRMARVFHSKSRAVHV